MQTLKTKCQSLHTSIQTIPLGYRLFALSSLTFLIIFNFLPFLAVNLSNRSQYVIQRFEYWRLITSFIAANNLFSLYLIVLVLSLYVMKITMGPLEDKLSTIYVGIEVIKQMFVINLSIDLVVYPFVLLGLIDSKTVAMQGIVLPMMIFLMMDTCKDPNGYFKMVGHQVFLKKKYISALIMIAVLASLRTNFFIFLLMNGLLMVEYSFKSKPFFALPYCFYLKLDSCVPTFIKNIKGYVPVQNCQSHLQEVCDNWGCERESQEEKLVQKRKDIQNTRQDEFKHHWINKESEQSQPSVQKKIKKERVGVERNNSAEHQLAENLHGTLSRMNNQKNQWEEQGESESASPHKRAEYLSEEKQQEEPQTEDKPFEMQSEEIRPSYQQEEAQQEEPKEPQQEQEKPSQEKAKKNIIRSAPVQDDEQFY